MNCCFWKCFFRHLLAIVCLIQPLVSEDEAEKAFTKIYKEKKWINKPEDPLSGYGSSMLATEQYRAYLQSFLEEANITSVVDLGCGDWAFSQAIDWGSINYIGFDVVKSIILQNQQKFGKANISFVHGNGVQSNLPEADLLICKDVLQHLPNSDIQLAIKQFHKFKYCLITNDVNPQTLTSDNPDISYGGHHFLDLTAPPFSVNGDKVLHYALDVRSRVEIKQVLLIVNNSVER